MQISIGHSLTEPGEQNIDVWWQTGADFALDFINNRAMQGGSSEIISNLLSCNRNSLGWAEDLNDNLSEFAVNSSRITNKGLLIEDLSINIYPNSTNIGLNGTAGAVITAIDTINIFDGWRIASDGQHWRRVGGAFLIPVVAGEVYTFTAYYKLGTSGKFYQGLTARDASSNVVNYPAILLDGDALETVWNGFSPNFNIKILSNGLKKLTYELTVEAGVNFIDFSGIGPQSTVVGEYIDSYGLQIEKGSFATSFIETSSNFITREADALVVQVDAGTYNMDIVFDDDSTQTFAGQVVGVGGWAIPDNLNREYIKNIVGFLA